MICTQNIRPNNIVKNIEIDLDNNIEIALHHKIELALHATVFNTE